MAYIQYTEQQKEQARRTDLCELLRSQGEQLKRSGSEYEWRDGSEKVTIRGNLWFHQYEQKGGDAIDFVRKYYNKSYPEAMEYLLGGADGTLVMAEAVPKKEFAEPFELPPRNDNMRRVYAYLLTKRGIDKDVLNTFARHGMIYESADYHNAVFVGYDQDGVPRHASYRGTGTESTFRGNKPSSTPEYSFHWSGKSDRLYLFEAPIDMLSYTPCTRTAGNSTAMPPAVSRIGCCFKCCVTIRVSKPSAFASTTMTVAETYIQKDR